MSRAARARLIGHVAGTDAPIALVFDVLTKPEHVSKWGATPPDRMKECSIDLRVGGTYHYSFVTPDGTECSFHGTYLEVERPFRTVETWLFEGWPDAEAVETWQLHETDGVTTVTMRLSFRDKAGRDHYPANAQNEDELTSSNGVLDSFDAMEDIIRSLLDPKETTDPTTKAQARELRLWPGPSGHAAAVGVALPVSSQIPVQEAGLWP